VSKFAEVPEWVEGPNARARARKSCHEDCQTLSNHKIANIV
jgi:hypothetical protein